MLISLSMLFLLLLIPFLSHDAVWRKEGHGKLKWREGWRAVESHVCQEDNQRHSVLLQEQSSRK